MLVLLVVIGSLLPADSVIIENLDAFCCLRRAGFCADLARARYEASSLFGRRSRLSLKSEVE
jgi:hypothetical protein